MSLAFKEQLTYVMANCMVKLPHFAPGIPQNMYHVYIGTLPLSVRPISPLLCQMIKGRPSFRIICLVLLNVAYLSHILFERMGH